VRCLSRRSGGAAKADSPRTRTRTDYEPSRSSGWRTSSLFHAIRTPRWQNQRTETETVPSSPRFPQEQVAADRRRGANRRGRLIDRHTTRRLPARDQRIVAAGRLAKDENLAAPLGAPLGVPPAGSFAPSWMEGAPRGLCGARIVITPPSPGCENRPVHPHPSDTGITRDVSVLSS
jgi:hypothetical protein